jgi:hypothetical protein
MVACAAADTPPSVADDEAKFVVVDVEVAISDPSSADAES